jgi:hypothetical protein
VEAKNCAKYMTLGVQDIELLWARRVKPEVYVIQKRYRRNHLVPATLGASALEKNTDID